MSQYLFFLPEGEPAARVILLLIAKTHNLFIHIIYIS
jgi:hypothetical protein